MNNRKQEGKESLRSCCAGGARRWEARRRQLGGRATPGRACVPLGDACLSALGLG